MTNSFKELFESVTPMVTSLFFDKCDVYAFSRNTMPNGSITVAPSDRILTDIPCRVYRKSINQPVEVGATTEIQEDLRIMVSPSVFIPEGSRIVVNFSNGRQETYMSTSGTFLSYVTHHEYTVSKDMPINNASVGVDVPDMIEGGDYGYI